MLRTIFSRPLGWRTLGAGLLSLTTLSAQALGADDGHLFDAGACHLESWMRANREATEFWALPGCTAEGSLVLALGPTPALDDDGNAMAGVTAQARTVVFKPLTPNGWGWGMALGTARDARNGSRDVYAFMPVSWSLQDNRSFVRANVGARHEGLLRRRQVTWGLGFEQPIAPRFDLIGETFVRDKDRPFVQMGLRYSVIQDKAQIDTSTGHRIGAQGNERWVAVGLRLLAPRWRP